MGKQRDWMIFITFFFIIFGIANAAMGKPTLFRPASQSPADLTNASNIESIPASSEIRCAVHASVREWCNLMCFNNTHCIMYDFAAYPIKGGHNHSCWTKRGIDGIVPLAIDHAETWGYWGPQDYAETWGYWGPQEFCPQGTFATSFQIKDDQTESDLTAINGIELHCEDPTQNINDPVRITSDQQIFGNWNGIRRCDNGYLTGLRLQTLAHQGAGDDVAAANLQIQCNWSFATTLDGGGLDMGVWSSWTSCPQDWVICGLQTRIEPLQDAVTGDDSSLNDVKMFCCFLN